ncbi:Leucyl aminopeptidase yscIV [Entomophthora muscae]|uniref:Leucyl aminopeptidase yscIV n=1 Tax=Entomophthora muscae TaxID=34485 RepID=A0ACC2UG12_9FUNG|nr:Leucyl aminopeptidase yscIV [Entomophthora muscae]
MCQLKDPNTFSNINDLATQHIALNLEVLPRDENFGSALHVDLQGIELGESFQIKVTYETTKEGGAIQFLDAK